MTIKTVLHVGCGGSRDIPVLQFQDYRQIRVDIDPTVFPDEVDDIRTLAKFENESADGIFSSHNLEHLDEQDVPLALRTFWRVLKPGGVAFLMVPDFRLACEWVADGRGEEIVYESPAGPICPLDMIFGYRAWTRGNEWQRHKTGFTVERLTAKLGDAGFAISHVQVGQGFDLIAVAEK